MVDTVATPMAYPGGPVSPLLIQSQQTDPRVSIMRQLAESNANNQTPILSPMSALARVIAGVAPAIGQIQLGSEAADRQKALGDTMGKALEAGQNGGGFDALARVLSQSPDPAAQQMALQYGVQNLTTKQGAQLQFMQELAKKGLTIEPGTGNVVPLPGYGSAEAANAGPVAQATAQGTATGTNTANAQSGTGGQAAVITATTPAKAALAGAEKTATEAAELPFVAPKTDAAEKAKLPYSVTAVHGVGAFPTSTILGTGPQAPAQSSPPAVLSQKGYDALPKGTPYRAPDGKIRVKQ